VFVVGYRDMWPAGASWLHLGQCQVGRCIQGGFSVPQQENSSACKGWSSSQDQVFKTWEGCQKYRVELESNMSDPENCFLRKILKIVIEEMLFAI
jgi:hypothetical protein